MTTNIGVQAHIQLGRTRPIRPSKLGLILECPWQFLLSTEHANVPQLLQGPWAILGNSMHKIIEHQARHHDLTGLEVRRLLEEKFERMVHALPVGLLRWVYSRHGIEGVLPPAAVLSATRLAYSNILNATLPADKTSENGPSRLYAETKLGRERKFSSAIFDLEGYPDLVYAKVDAVHVVDFKLGLGRDEAGQPKRSYVLQVAAYGLVAREYFGNKKVVLELRAAGDDWVQHLDDDLEAAAREVVSKATNLLPKGKVFTDREIASPGLHCRNCSFRPGCSVYQERLLAEDKTQPMAVSPFDVVGDVVAAKRSGESWRLALDARPDGRRVVVDGIIEALFQGDLHKAGLFSGYGLGTSEVKGRGRYVANLHYWSQASPRNSAFTALVNDRKSMFTS